MSVTVFFIMRKNRTIKNSIMTQPHDYGADTECLPEGIIMSGF